MDVSVVANYMTLYKYIAGYLIICFVLLFSNH